MKPTIVENKKGQYLTLSPEDNGDFLVLGKIWGAGEIPITYCYINKKLDCVQVKIDILCDYLGKRKETENEQRTSLS